MEFEVLRNVAPDGDATDYDRRHLSLYAALLDAEADGAGWREAARLLMHLDPDEEMARECWQSHRDRAHWIIEQGLAEAIKAFGKRSIK